MNSDSNILHNRVSSSDIVVVSKKSDRNSQVGADLCNNLMGGFPSSKVQHLAVEDGDVDALLAMANEEDVCASASGSNTARFDSVKPLNPGVGPGLGLLERPTYFQFPLVFYHGSCVGGLAELEEMKETGELTQIAEDTKKGFCTRVSKAERQSRVSLNKPALNNAEARLVTRRSLKMIADW